MVACRRESLMVPCSCYRAAAIEQTSSSRRPNALGQQTLRAAMVLASEDSSELISASIFLGTSTCKKRIHTAPAKA